VTDNLPESILTRTRQLADLFQAHPTAELGEALHLMTEMLHIAVHGDTWARPESPQEVWLGLLAGVCERRPSPGPRIIPVRPHTGHW
jgi:hypothetical protein